MHFDTNIEKRNCIINRTIKYFVILLSCSGTCSVGTHPRPPEPPPIYVGKGSRPPPPTLFADRLASLLMTVGRCSI